MSTKDDFTDEEWMDVMNAPLNAGGLVLSMSPSGPMGLVHEIRAMFQAMHDLTKANATSPLMQAIAEYIAHKPSKEEEAELQALSKQQQQEFKGLKPEEAKQKMMDNLREAVALVSSKSSPEDVQAYKELVFGVAEKVAGAAKEGGFMGIGGVVVSDTEKTLLDEIKAELDL